MYFEGGDVIGSTVSMHTPPPRLVAKQQLSYTTHLHFRLQQSVSLQALIVIRFALCSLLDITLLS